jgi:hypothetical protein
MKGGQRMSGPLASLVQQRGPNYAERRTAHFAQQGQPSQAVPQARPNAQLLARAMRGRF